MIITVVNPNYDEVQVGQKWRNATLDRVVTVRAIFENTIQYGDYGNDRTYELSYDDFCRNFCLEIEPIKGS